MSIRMSKKKLEWTDQHDKRYSALYSKFVKAHPDAIRETYITDNANPRKLLSFIKNSDYAIGSKKNFLFMVGRYLQIKDNQHYMKYLQAGTDIRNIIDNIEADNYKDVKEKQYALSHDQLIEIIDELKPTYTEMSYKKHMQFLILCMTTLNAPLRTDFYTSAQIITTSMANDGVDNYVFINHKTKQIQFIVNTDKVSKTKFYKMNPKYTTIDITDLFLKELIFYSYSQHPRTYLLQAEQNDKKITQNTYLNWLRKITKSDLINNDMLRSSYITWFYKHNKYHKEKDELARKMRHSIMSASTYYNKRDDPGQTEVSASNVDDIANENNQLKTKLKDCETNCEEKKLTQKQLDKKRYDVIYNLNNKGTKPRDSTLKTYNIKYNDTTRKYY